MLSRIYYLIIKALEPLHRSNFFSINLSIVAEKIIAIAYGWLVMFSVDKDGSLFAKEWNQKVKISNCGYRFYPLGRVSCFVKTCCCSCLNQINNNPNLITNEYKF